MSIEKAMALTVNWLVQDCSESGLLAG